MKYTRVEKIETLEELEYILEDLGMENDNEGLLIDKDWCQDFITSLHEGNLYNLTDEQEEIEDVYEPITNCEVIFNGTRLLQTIRCTLYMYKDYLYAESELFQ